MNPFCVSSALLVKVVGSLVASRHVVVKMLEFAARHNIKPEIEELDMGLEVRLFFFFFWRYSSGLFFFYHLGNGWSIHWSNHVCVVTRQSINQ